MPDAESLLMPASTRSSPRTTLEVRDVLEPTTGDLYNRDPRGIARKAKARVDGDRASDPRPPELP
jgi:hypothetical protein